MVEKSVKSPYNCPDKKVLEKFLSFEDLMLGESHGTNEVPAFLKCLVDFGLNNTDERIIVSLEMTSSAREPLAEFWHKDESDDGRSSKAMKRLVSYLVELEDQLIVDLHFQHRSRYFETDEELQKFKQNRPQIVGQEIRQLAQKGKMFVLAGNIHTMKFIPDHIKQWSNHDKSKLRVEGEYVGPSFTHIQLDSASGGEAWFCGEKGCGKQSLFIQKEAVRGSFISEIDLRMITFIIWISMALVHLNQVKAILFHHVKMNSQRI